MLKKLRIINFQSHKDTTIQFSDGFNVFQGDSDGGKSAIIRAIAAVCYNRWSNESVRIGQQETSIQLTTDIGVVKLTKNPKKKINSYSGVVFQNNQEFYFQTIGTTVPQVVYHITGMRQLNVGDSVTDIPNIMFQLQKHYMLAQVSGKSCTSNLIARVFDKVTGLGGMQQLINQISSSMLSDKKNITKNIAQIDDLNLKLVPQQQIDQMQVKLTEVNNLKQKIQLLQENLNKMHFVLQQYNLNVHKQSLLNVDFLNFDSENAEKCLKNLQISNKQFEKCDDLFKKIINANDRLNQVKISIEMCRDVDQQQLEISKKTCNKLYVASKLLNSFYQKQEKLEQINGYLQLSKNIDNANKFLSDSKNGCNLLYKADKLLNKNNKLQIEIQEANKNYNFYNNQSNELNNKLSSLKKQCKLCPICGKPFEDCQNGEN